MAGRPPSLGTVLALAFVITLVPGILVAVVLRLVGLAIGPALLLGLLAVFVGMGCYPRVLRHLSGGEGR